MKKVIRGLQRAGSEMQAAMTLKNSACSDKQALEVLEKAQLQQGLRLRPETIYALQTRVSSCQNALSRHAGLELLSKMGSLDRDLVAQMYMQYGDPERALAAGYMDKLDQTKLEMLIKCGTADEIFEAFSSGELDLSSSSSAWHQTAALFIDQRLLNGLKAIWHVKPRSVSQWTLRQACIQAAQGRDREFLAELEPLVPTGEDPILARLLAPLVDPATASSLLSKTTNPTNVAIDARPPAGSPTALYNASLQHALEHSTVLYLLALYRSYRIAGLAPDETTWYILAKACFKLGNSKQLAYEIWQEHTALGLVPSRRVAESLLLSQLQGLSCHSALWFVAQMHSHKIFLRNHIHFRLLKAFEPSTSYKEIFGDIRKLQAYQAWDPELAAAEAGRYAGQSRRNCQIYLNGGDLDQMQAFEQAREVSMG